MSTTEDERITAIADYLDWIEARPFGAPTDLETYSEHLKYDEWKRQEADRVAHQS